MILQLFLSVMACNSAWACVIDFATDAAALTVQLQPGVTAIDQICIRATNLQCCDNITSVINPAQTMTSKPTRR
jgi:hypothetical protein